MGRERYFYLWQALVLQAGDMERLLHRSMRGSLALSATRAMSSGDLLRLAFGGWQLRQEMAKKADGLVSRVPTQVGPEVLLTSGLS